MNNEHSRQNLDERAYSTIQRMVRVKTLEMSTIINVPVLYPSGSTTKIGIEQSGEYYRLSDMGYGLIEAMSINAKNFYKRSAKEVVSQFGLQFDGTTIFAPQVPIEFLERSIIDVANSSSQAAQGAIRNSAVS